MDNRYNFYISAFIAISSYILLILIFVLYLQKESVAKFSNNLTQTVLEVNIVSQKKEIKENKTKAKTTTINKVEKTIAKKNISQNPTKTTDLKSLFAKVSTKSSNVVEKEVNRIKKSKVESRFKSKYERSKKAENIKLSKLIDVKENDSGAKKQKIGQSSNGKFDKYYSMINDKILTRWYNYPLLNSQKYLVVVNITIDTQGRFSYHVISLSGFENVDNTIKEFLNNQKLETYPIPPDGMVKTIKINFKPE